MTQGVGFRLPTANNREQISEEWYAVGRRGILLPCDFPRRWISSTVAAPAAAASAAPLGLSVVLQILELLLHQIDEGLHAAAKLLGCAALDEPVEAEEPVLPDLRFELLPVAETDLGNRAQQEAVFLLGEGLDLVGAVYQLEIAPGILIRLDLSTNRLKHVVLPVDLRFAFLDVCDDPRKLRHLLVPRPEHVIVRTHLRQSFALDLVGHALRVGAPKLFARAAKRLKVSPVPVVEATAQ
mmetsp:Transcript_8046/g.19963  ORF Transcript_8046/g.19963 Transcript_8046/m.19963 type:complete len:239 (-) Transcript_8046:2606-3322(-)